LGSNPVPLFGHGFVVAAPCSSFRSCGVPWCGPFCLLALKKVREASFNRSKLFSGVFWSLSVCMRVKCVSDGLYGVACVFGGGSEWFPPLHVGGQGGALRFSPKRARLA